MKYENPEVIEVEDTEAGDEDGESCEEILNSILPPREVSSVLLSSYNVYIVYVLVCSGSTMGSCGGSGCRPAPPPGST